MSESGKIILELYCLLVIILFTIREFKKAKQIKAAIKCAALIPVLLYFLN